MVRRYFPAGELGPSTILIEHPGIDFRSDAGRSAIESLSRKYAVGQERRRGPVDLAPARVVPRELPGEDVRPDPSPVRRPPVRLDGPRRRGRPQPHHPDRPGLPDRPVLRRQPEVPGGGPQDHQGRRGPRRPAGRPGDGRDDGLDLDGGRPEGGDHQGRAADVLDGHPGRLRDPGPAPPPPLDLPLPDRHGGPGLPRLARDHRAGLQGHPQRARPLGRARLEGELLPLRDPGGRGGGLQHLPDGPGHRGGAEARARSRGPGRRSCTPAGSSARAA